nr:hypothetical protein [Providencia heimbachae]
MVQSHDGAQRSETAIPEALIVVSGALGQFGRIYCADHHHGCRQLAHAGRAVHVMHDVMPDCVRHPLDTVHCVNRPVQWRVELVGWSGLSHQPQRSYHHRCTGRRRHCPRRSAGLYHGV